MLHPIITRGLIATAVLVIVSSLGTNHAQTVYGLDGAAGVVVETTGPSAGPCGYPTGPLVSTYPTGQPFGCATPGPILGPGLGDVAVNMVTDTSWATDGMIIAGYTAGGVVFTSFAVPPGTILPGLFTGMGWDSAGGVLWLTDGAMAVGVTPPPPPGCGLLPAVVVPAFPLATPGVVGDIEWDPSTGTLFVCDVTGVVSNFVPGGAPGPFPPFPASPGICGIGAGLTGIAVDTAATLLIGVPVLYVTDGGMIAYIDAFGAAAPLNFYTTANCIPTPAPFDGLAYAARPIAFGVGGDNTGLIGPSIGSVGQSILPNPLFTVTAAGSVGGSLALLYASTAPLCPAPLILGGIPLNITPAPPVYFLGVYPVLPAGTATAPVPIAGLPVGATFFLQWFISTPMPSLQSSPGLALTISMP